MTRSVNRAAILTATLLFGFVFPLRIAAATPDAGSLFLMNLRDQAIQQLADTAISEQERQRRFQTLLRENFDLLFISRFVLGRYWQRADESARSEFVSAFEGYITQRFTPVFAEYQGQRIEIDASISSQKSGDISSVASKILRDEKEPISITWRLQKRGDAYRIIDVVAAGVSMAITLRSEFASMLKSNGGDLRNAARALRSKFTQSSASANQDG